MASKGLENTSLIRTRKSSFQFEISYAKAKNIPIGKFIPSPTFTAGGYDWSLQYYPQGKMPQNSGPRSSLFLCLESDVVELTVEYDSQVVDRNGNCITIGGPEVLIFRNLRSWEDLNFVAISNTTEKLCCVNGILVISCSIRVLTDPEVVKTYPGGLCQHIEKLWDEKKRFDLTFEVEGESIPAHKFMLAARSPVFETELFGTMAEYMMEHIRIDEMKPEVFRALLHFVYTDQLANDGSSELLQGLFVAADRYGLGKLTLLCEEKLENNLSVDTVVTTLLLADRHNRTGLKKRCLEFASRPENFIQVGTTEEYLTVMSGAPSLFAELRDKAKCFSDSAKKADDLLADCMEAGRCSYTRFDI